jgi:hypothetical protein
MLDNIKVLREFYAQWNSLQTKDEINTFKQCEPLNNLRDKGHINIEFLFKTTEGLFLVAERPFEMELAAVGEMKTAQEVARSHKRVVEAKCAKACDAWKHLHFRKSRVHVGFFNC